MDANQSRFHLVLGRNDWGELTNGLAYDSASESAGLCPQLFVFPPRAHEPRLTLDSRRGAAIDAFENHYWIAENGTEIRYLSPRGKEGRRFWPVASGCSEQPVPGGFFQPEPPEPPAPRNLFGLAVTKNQYLVAGIDSPAGLLVFDLAGGGAPQEIRSPVSIPFRPFDMAVGEDGRLWILDRSGPFSGASPTGWKLFSSVRLLQRPSLSRSSSRSIRTHLDRRASVLRKSALNFQC